MFLINIFKFANKQVQFKQNHYLSIPLINSFKSC